MAQLLISKKAENDWRHTITDGAKVQEINDPNVIALGSNNVFSLSLGAQSLSRQYTDFQLADITLQDDSTSRPVEGPFLTFNELFLRLANLNYIGFVPGILT